MSFLNVMAKVGLVKLDEDEQAALKAKVAKPTATKPTKADDIDIDKLLSEDVNDLLKPTSKGTATVVPAAIPADPNNVSVSFDVIYKKASVPAASFSAEKLLRLMDKLKGMDPINRRTAVLAMDAADDDWTIDGVIVDAKNKIAALDGAKASLRATVTQEEAKARDALKAQDHYLTEATKTIRQQIAELETQLAAETESVKAGKAEIQSQYDKLLATATQEETRLNVEVTRLKEITTTFVGEVKNG